MKKFLVVFLLLNIMIIGSVFAINFSDMNSSHWAYEYVTDLTAKGVINGYEDGTFKPEGTITRGEFLKLVIMAALPKNVDLSDAESNMKHWAGTYVWIAERYGVISTGNINMKNINQPITRLEMVRMISRADMIMKRSSLAQSKQLIFSDTILLSKDDEMYLTHAYSKGLVSGYPDGTFGTDKNMTRAEAATMIHRFTK